MSRPSLIDQLPAEVRQALNDWLGDPGITDIEATDRLHALLDAIGHPELKPSRHSVNRYRNRMNEVGKRLQEQHAMAEMWVSKFGRMPQGKLGQIIIQMVHGMAYDTTLKLSEAELDADDMPGVVKMLKDLALTMEKTERASSLNAQREAEIRKQAQADAAKAVEAEAKRQGASAATIDSLRQAIMQELAG